MGEKVGRHEIQEQVLMADAIPPIVIYGDGLCEVYPGIAVACQAVEAIDVNDGLYEAFDSTGSPLLLPIMLDALLSFQHRETRKWPLYGMWPWARPCGRMTVRPGACSYLFLRGRYQGFSAGGADPSHCRSGFGDRASLDAVGEDGLRLTES